ncbi:MAG: hypothetical protein BroJett011_18330 [Chloroflexota bacterium]|nr:MAG: hypothetical protein BroJett011_18330 [Chloroflexota bacterium]
MNLNWRDLTVADVALEPLLDLLTHATEPVPLGKLVVAFAKMHLRSHGAMGPKPVPYDPKLTYTVGQSVQLPDGQVARVARISLGQNPTQGQFQIIAFAEAHLPRLAAGLAPAISEEIPSSNLDEVELEEQARELLQSDTGLHLHHLVTQALQADNRLVSFDDEWWLAEKLPYTAVDNDISMVRELLREQGIQVSRLVPTPAADLAQLLWVVSAADSAQLQLATFSLSCALARHSDFCYQRAGGWVLTEHLPDYRIRRQPLVPRIQSRVRAEVATEIEVGVQLEEEQVLIRSLEENDAADVTSSDNGDPWQDLYHWRRVAWPEVKVKLLGQHWIEGFLPLKKAGLRRVIPPSHNEIELAWFIYQRPDNIEGRFEVIIDYRQGVVIGGQTLCDFLGSQGILPGCYLYVHRRNDSEYDIYPRLLPQPVEVPCKFAEIDEQGQLCIETVVIPVQYEHAPDYIISETRLNDLKALWHEATKLGLSFFDILVIHVFPKLAQPGEPVHWRKLWEATFFGYRMGSQQAIQRELRRNCFVPVGDGYYRFEPERGYSFRDKEGPVKPPIKPEPLPPQDDKPLLTWADLATLEIKYLFAGPSPLGRVLNYIRRIKEGTYTTTLRGPRAPDNLDQWTVYAMVGLGLVEPAEETGKTLQLTPAGATFYPRLLNFGEFSEDEDSATVQQIRSQLVVQDVELYHLLRRTLLNSPSLHALLTYLRSLKLPLQPRDLYIQFADFCPEMTKVTAEHRLPGLLRIAEFCGVINWDTQGRLKLSPVEATLSSEPTPEVTPPSSPTQPPLPPISPPSEEPGPETELEPEPPVTVEAPPVKIITLPGSPPASIPQKIGPTERAWTKSVLASSKREEMQTKTLFSPYYLETRLADHPEWGEDPQPVFVVIQALWEKASQYGAAWNEAQTEEEFVKPVLAALGWSYIVQAKSNKKGQITRPDYALFATDADRDAAYPHQGHDDAFYSRTLVIGEAKYWGRPLSQKESSGRDAWKVGANPSHQMVSYLVGTRVSWGILTNGQVWRLYSREVSSTASEFYEINLADIFTATPAEAVEQFKRFWLFFRRAAFTPDAQGKSFVQRVHEGSATYARQISDKLKELVFDEVMPEIAGGFVTYRYQQMGQQAETEESLRQIYQASLSLLYKLLFLLYAEARNLLPLTNPGYRQKSLTELARWAAEQLDRSLPLSTATHATDKYDALLALFRRIDQGDPSLGIPRYNGGLFNPATSENQFLTQHKLSDRAVARAADILVRDAGQPVDYAYISVRNLGAIYEGLLENKLRVVDAAGGQVELINDKGERKASGSYYTPDYIVEYIVQHTLEPILAERDGQFQAAMDRCGDLRRQLAHTADPSANRLLRGQLEQAERDAREAFLGIKTLDPAMGSGHFLVNAVDHLTDGIIQRLQTYHDAQPDVPWEWNPIQQLIERVRQDILAEMERQGIGVDPARLDDTALLTRLVMKRCIYGVDLNPMAVELAKLSLWLHSFTVGAPLSFLDHHLRWGNSLIGSDVRTVEQAIKQHERGQAVQFGLFAGPFAGLLDLTSLMTEVAEQSDATLADVHHSAEVFDQFQKELTPYKQVLDLWVSQYFGNKEANNFLTLYGADVLPALRGQQQVADTYQVAIRQSRDLWHDKRFFHWDLEFPEIFVDLRRRDWAENPGFDAVVGNPPYVRVQTMQQADPAAVHYFSQTYNSASGSYDIYMLMAERSQFLINSNGMSGLILPNKFMTATYGEPFRKIIASRKSLHTLIDFTYGQVFEQATTYTCLLFLSGTKRETASYLALEDPTQIVSGDLSFIDIFLENLTNEPWTFTTPAVSKILGKVSQVSNKLQEVSARLFQGIRTSANEVYVLEDAIAIGDLIEGFSASLNKRVRVEKELCINFVGGDQIGHYEVLPGTKIVLIPYEIVEDGARLIPLDELRFRYPETYSYFAANENALKLRERSKLAGTNEWHGFIYPKNLEVIREPKILSRDIVSRATYALDGDGSIAFVTGYGITLSAQFPYSMNYVLAILNSNFGDFALKQLNTFMRGGYVRIFSQYLEPLPIRTIFFTTPPDERTRLAAEAQRLAETFIAGHQPLNQAAYTGSPVSAFIAARLAVAPNEQTDVVHDLLAHLAGQMIELNKQKQGHLSGFRLDLAGYLNEKQLGKLNRLYTPKKPPAPEVKNYPQKLAEYQTAIKLAQAQLQGLAGETLDLDDFWRLNQAQWMWLLRQNLGQVDNMSNLVAVYQNYHHPLAPLMRRLQRTDWLIDQIVYQLYGLTEEEIAVMEGNKGPDT